MLGLVAHRCIGVPSIMVQFAPQQGRKAGPEALYCFILYPITRHSRADQFWRVRSPNGEFRATAPAEACPGVAML